MESIRVDELNELNELNGLNELNELEAAEFVERVDSVSVNERGTWLPEDSDNFHWTLSKYTQLKGGELVLDHRYLDPRDIAMTDILACTRIGDQVTDEELVRQMEQLSESNSSKSNPPMYRLAVELWAAAGRKHTIRQINTKHINTRSRWSVPFKSLYQCGYLIKNQSRKAKDSPDEPRPPRTNIGPKSQPAVRTLRKLIRHREVFWNPVTQAPPEAGTPNAANPAGSAGDDASEAERWVRAMVRRHGRPMVDYLEKCAVNMANSYLLELAYRRGRADVESPVTIAEPDRIVALLDGMLDEIMPLVRANGSKKSHKRAPRKARSSSLVLSELAKAAPSDAPATPAASVAPVTPGLINIRRLAPDGTDYKRPTTSRPAANRDDDDDEHLDAAGLPLMIKKSRSHILSRDGSTAMSSHLGGSTYGSMGSIADTLLHGHSAALSPTPETAKSAAQYDDGVFAQFVDYGSCGSIAKARGTGRRHASDAHVPAELAEAIFNMTVKTGTTPVPSAGQPGPAMFSGSASHPVSAYRADGFGSQLHPHPADHAQAGRTPQSISRSGSDETRVAYPALSEAASELHSLIGGSQDGRAFTFQVPAYSWDADSASKDDVLMHQQQQQQQQQQQHQGLPHGMEQSLAQSLSQGVGHSTSYPSLYGMGFAGLAAGDESPPISSGVVQAAPLPGLDAAMDSCFSTTLVLVNGTPSHIELTHDGTSGQPNPIVLPITGVKQHS
ncbi:hypothetical protein H4R18_003657 [Coemansia javaensis]|uniref:Uncharacterized protein n=1 Tax=Coemansia javaensis TaxID=2761396 RepID=A0A9W8HD32_9FUNG|nr:hypothetical protein H4R18_003657 [Coemansia javaensis]